MDEKQDFINLLEIYTENNIDCVMNVDDKLGDIEIQHEKMSENASFVPESIKMTLDELKKEVEEFEGCELKKSATNAVFSDGNPESKIMLIGEAPGANEDLEGIPFCGASGKLLNKMLESIGLDRTSVYITNTIFWRPPGNRRPTEDEINQCRPFLEKHIAIIKPKIIVLVGSTAAGTVLQSKETISKLRGKMYEYTNKYLDFSIKITVIFHPAYLMRQPMQKKFAWEDLKLIKEQLLDMNIM